MSKFVQLMTTDNTIACVNLSNVLYAKKGENGLVLVFTDNQYLNVLLSMEDFYKLATNKS